MHSARMNQAPSVTESDKEASEEGSDPEDSDNDPAASALQDSPELSVGAFPSLCRLQDLR